MRRKLIRRMKDGRNKICRNYQTVFQIDFTRLPQTGPDEVNRTNYWVVKSVMDRADEVVEFFMTEKIMDNDVSQSADDQQKKQAEELALFFDFHQFKF